jgi:D-alanyl-lipoteichoic acid acyltransferase DltB (MBOAT superfamily)
MFVKGMLYTLVLLLCVIVLLNVRSRKLRQAVLLTGSYALYLTWGPWFAAVLLISTVMNFLVGKWLRQKPSGIVLTMGVFLNLVLLSTFKYLPAIALDIPFSSIQKLSHIALPLGISFWTFQAMSYLFDLYRGEELDPSFFEFALYMVFFPVAISGPVCRLVEMLPQFRSESPMVWSDIGRGLGRIATGVLMMQVAKLLGQGILAGDGIDSGFDHVHGWSGADVWCLAFGYGLQLFFDFAGYSHIAIGAAKVLGFTVPENFSRPFQSTSPSVFWTRWHMSLSFWIRDYVFLPMAVLRREVWWRNAALVISMILFGLWHKASVLFVLWGCYHGMLLVLHRQLQRWIRWVPPTAILTPISWVTTMALVNLGWILFRANSLPMARQMLLAVLSPANYSSHVLSGSLYLLVLVLAAGYGLVQLVSEALDHNSDEARGSESEPLRGLIGFMARNRWFWLPPIYALALFSVSMVTLTHGTDAAQLMYRRF